MDQNHLTIKHDGFGDELFEVETATYNIYECESGIWEFVIRVTTGTTITGVFKGQTIVNGSNANTCDADILLHHQFRKDSELRRGVI